MQKCGDIDECISTPEADELAAKLDEKDISNLPLPGQVDFINGGPPCQVKKHIHVIILNLNYPKQSTQKKKSD